MVEDTFVREYKENWHFFCIPLTYSYLCARFNTQNDAKRKIIYEKATEYAASMASETVTRCSFRFI